MFDYSKLNGRIVEKFGTRGAFASLMQVSLASVCKKLSGKNQWKQAEIAKAAMLLDISTSEIPAYFFTPKVQISEQKNGG